MKQRIMAVLTRLISLFKGPSCSEHGPYTYRCNLCLLRQLDEIAKDRQERRAREAAARQREMVEAVKTALREEGLSK